MKTLFYFIAIICLCKYCLCCNAHNQKEPQWPKYESGLTLEELLEPQQPKCVLLNGTYSGELEQIVNSCDGETNQVLFFLKVHRNMVRECGGSWRVDENVDVTEFFDGNKKRKCNHKQMIAVNNLNEQTISVVVDEIVSCEPGNGSHKSCAKVFAGQLSLK